MLHIILFQPEIPQNTGIIGRMCAITETRLHLIHPLGFEISDRSLKRAGMDYWTRLDVFEHVDWRAFIDSDKGPKGNLFLFTTQGARSYWDAQFSDEDGLIFGNAGHGAPDWLHNEPGVDRLKIPQWGNALRSLNLATAAGIATYEALRQIRGAETV